MTPAPGTPLGGERPGLPGAAGAADAVMLSDDGDAVMLPCPPACGCPHSGPNSRGSARGVAVGTWSPAENAPDW